RMSTLIDDLLAFSRLGRQAIRRVELDMGGLVETIVQEQRSNSGVDQVRFVMHPLPSARADPALLRQVWVNLLSNAVKYSGTRRQPVVEIGSRDENSQTVYYVRDNGAGFDMRFYDKLFAVFQRLHRAEDFPGTGIGLAIVHRIVTRHGGRVWAEGKVGEGATFYFTLPEEGSHERRH
ncbi:MAG: hypothetical protein HYY36_08395, partial [Gammaproteobacteria bacterium]|nr:hypothetical protein [Gammaproteobacteria bacterium]